MNSQFNLSQKQRLQKVIAQLKQAAMVIDEIDDEFYKLGSFPESPMGHTSHELESTASYIQHWIDRGVEL